MSRFLQIAEHLIARERKPMSARELVDCALQETLFPDSFTGRTPHQTMKSKLSVHIRELGADSVFVRTEPGRFYLRTLLESPSDEYKAKHLLPPRSQERVLVVHNAWLDSNGYRFQGIKKRVKGFLAAMLDQRVCSYIPRMQAEQTDTYKQVLTYILVRRGKKVLCFTRGRFNRAEDFLRGARCIGFGGHVTSEDYDLFNHIDLGVSNSAVRELSEEIDLPEEDRDRLSKGCGLRVIGVLNDDSSITGYRHIAVLFEYTVSRSDQWRNIQRGEQSVTKLSWIDPLDSHLEIAEFEYWSQLLLQSHCGTKTAFRPSFKIRRPHPLRPPHTLCVVGAVGSGKSLATQFLRDHLGYEEINSGKTLANLMNVPPVPITPRSEFQSMAWSFIQDPQGPRTLAEALLQLAETSSSSRVLVDGIRQAETLREYRRLSKATVGVLLVHTPPRMAYSFFANRSPEKLSINEYMARLRAPVEAEVQRFLGMSDAIIYNWAGRSSFEQTVRDLMEHLGVGTDEN